MEKLAPYLNIIASHKPTTTTHQISGSMSWSEEIRRRAALTLNRNKFKKVKFTRDHKNNL